MLKRKEKKTGLASVCIFLFLLQVNGKKYPQAKLLLGQMGALHPANRLAAYITGRLRPTMLDLSTLSTAISKAESDAKLASSEPQSAEVPTTEISKTPFPSNTTSTSTVTSPNAHASTQKQIGNLKPYFLYCKLSEL